MNIDTALTNLRDIFGFPDFRPGQRQVVEALLDGRPALAIFPTGGGKSLCYQLPALQLDGVCLVVSPLIALMKDQVDGLQRLGVSAARLDSTLDADAVRDIYDRMANGSLDLLYVAPERLGNEGFRSRLRRTNISMLAIDEAHCISAWGHNFRPDYLKIAAFATELGIARVLALTATATPSVSRDVCAVFGIRDEDHVQTGFHRANLTLRVHACTGDDRLPRLIERVQQTDGPAIVYVTLQKTAERVAQALKRAGVQATAYHAGMKPDVRATVQEAFMEGRERVIVATIAFGMGIDKADIRAVFHYNLPKSLESYSQEIGRAGRDGEPSVCELFACANDQHVLDNFSHGDTPTRESLHGLVSELFGADESFSVSRYALSNDHDIRPLVVATVLTYLELDGHLQATGPFYAGYKIRFIVPKHDVIAGFDERRQAYLSDLFSRGKMGRTWLALEPETLADIPRDRLVATLGYLEQKRFIETRPSGLRHGYRRTGPVDLVAIVDSLDARFATRETNDLARTARVLAFAEHTGCLTQELVGYFGESMGRCGHCGPCLGEPTQPLPRPPNRELGSAERQQIADVLALGHAQLAHPRAMTRFLCGLRSPATGGRGGIQRDRRFGCLEDWPFLDVLAAVDAQQAA